MIGSAAELVAWIRANLPALDEDRFEPWHTGSPAPGAHTARIEVRIHTPAARDRVTSITLTAAPVGDLPS
ncbi:hypothetical protein ACIBJI_34100 [Nocardia sp. NPDC050408]|uniref:hypothetical protein n=1 Tax=Nocardia sp. NPDC050408 TaxID=3364319 RepID=UPI0037B465D6